jgi:hypothetical protein
VVVDDQVGELGRGVEGRLVQEADVCSAAWAPRACWSVPMSTKSMLSSKNRP